MPRKDSQGDVLRCSFCGKSQDEVRRLIAGPAAYICDECIDLCNDIILEEGAAEQSKSRKRLLTPKELNQKLDEYIIGQIKAKKILSVAVYNHYKRIEANAIRSEVELQKSNVLLIGPTGSGKTLLAQTLARILDVPFTITDATTLTEAGYVGEDVENIILRLVDTTNILFVCGGAFHGLEKIIERRISKRTMGFEAQLYTRNDKPLGELLAQVQPEDLLKFGLIPEFIGRLPIVATLDELTEEDFVRILTAPKNALVRQYQKYFDFEKVKLKFTDEALRAIAHEALRRKTGARGLRSIMEEIMLDTMYELPSRNDVQECMVNEEAVARRQQPALLYKQAS